MFLGYSTSLDSLLKTASTSHIIADSSKCVSVLLKNKKQPVEKQQCKSSAPIQSLDADSLLPSSCTVQSDLTLLNHIKFADQSNSIILKNLNSLEISEVGSCNFNVEKQIDTNSLGISNLDDLQKLHGQLMPKNVTNTPVSHSTQNTLNHLQNSDITPILMSQQSPAIIVAPHIISPNTPNCSGFSPEIQDSKSLPEVSSDQLTKDMKVFSESTKSTTYSANPLKSINVPNIKKIVVTQTNIAVSFTATAGTKLGLFCNKNEHLTKPALSKKENILISKKKKYKGLSISSVSKRVIVKRPKPSKAIYDEIYTCIDTNTPKMEKELDGNDNMSIFNNHDDKENPHLSFEPEKINASKNTKDAECKNKSCINTSMNSISFYDDILKKISEVTDGSLTNPVKVQTLTPMKSKQLSDSKSCTAITIPMILSENDLHHNTIDDGAIIVLPGIVQENIPLPENNSPFLKTEDSECSENLFNKEKSKRCFKNQNSLSQPHPESSLLSGKRNDLISIYDDIMNKISEATEHSLTDTFKERAFTPSQNRLLSYSKPSTPVVISRISVDGQQHNTLTDSAVQDMMPLLLPYSPDKSPKLDNSVTNDEKLELITSFSNLKACGHTGKSINEKLINTVTPTFIQCENYNILCNNSITHVDYSEANKFTLETDMNNYKETISPITSTSSLRKMEIRETLMGSFVESSYDPLSCSTTSDDNIINAQGLTSKIKNVSVSDKCSNKLVNQRSVKPSKFPIRKCSISDKTECKTLKQYHNNHTTSTNCLQRSKQCCKLNPNIKHSKVSSNILTKLAKKHITNTLKGDSHKRTTFTQSFSSGKLGTFDKPSSYKMTQKSVKAKLNILTDEKIIGDHSSSNNNTKKKYKKHTQHDFTISDKTTHKILMKKSVCSSDNVDFILFSDKHRPHKRFFTGLWRSIHKKYQNAVKRYAEASSVHEMQDCFKDIRYCHYFV